MNEVTVTLQLGIERSNNLAREVARARRTIEKSHLRRHKMKKVSAEEYELTFDCEGDMDLDGQVYALLGEIKREAIGRGCVVKLRVREKGGRRYW
jgi:hypothetical protein